MTYLKVIYFVSSREIAIWFSSIQIYLHQSHQANTIKMFNIIQYEVSPKIYIIFTLFQFIL